ncbi:MAG: nucleotide exchange factor GrpE [Desulfamplus sp.]|nr:nucleotide exchange factor GrpE [Desulfamplus sp.]
MGITDMHAETINNIKPCNSEQSPCTAENKTVVPAIEELQASLAAERDRVLRLSAEFENYKKRSSREMADFRKFANESILKQLLTVVDNLERAISSATPNDMTGGQNSEKGENKPNHNGQKAEQSVSQNCIVQGIEMTFKDLIKLFEAFSVKAVQAQGKPFDPMFHQAVTHQESDEHPDNTVIAEFQKGYLLHERLLRPSMVVVSKSPSKQEPA